ncbi:hypothetical protein ACTTAL_09690 [Rhodobacter capsulatus]|uniref:hypothetical protein n=1 Tax=Rhodobacter capsulatus TaxID=1061 RepID=UPI0003D348E2|nr:hypothetical protein [Rhodobacter capsulatus]ETD91989.1 hypothetical protein U713_01395 [Rhodobacter capsulatus YW2]
MASRFDVILTLGRRSFGVTVATQEEAEALELQFFDNGYDVEILEIETLSLQEAIAQIEGFFK